MRQLVKKCTKEDIGDLADAEYANDSCLLAECLENIIQLTDLLAEESQKWGLDKNAKNLRKQNKSGASTVTKRHKSLSATWK